jgi:hypothetical protein
MDSERAFNGVQKAAALESETVSALVQKKYGEQSRMWDQRIRFMQVFDGLRE